MFRSANVGHLVKFNSANSSMFLDEYESFVTSELSQELSAPSHKTFAPSAFRCDRRSWFRLRGTSPDVVPSPDRVLDFTARIGEACHRIIQRNLKTMLRADWIDVRDYLRESEDISSSYVTEIDDSGLETRIEFADPPVRFACDGIIRFRDELYLLEIKSSEYASWNELVEPKPHHVDQVKCYCTLLGLSHVFFVYIDRQYGGLKCFEISVSSSDKLSVQNRFRSVMKSVETNLAPKGLPVGDPWCAPSYCPYYKTCSEYGRYAT